MDTVTLTIDGQQVTVAKGTTLLQAAIQSGHEVPYYCYHPGLGIDGSCRVCLVKIEKMPKLQVSCSVVATEGMVVQTDTPEVVAARAGVFELTAKPRVVPAEDIHTVAASLIAMLRRETAGIVVG